MIKNSKIVDFLISLVQLLHLASNVFINVFIMIIILSVKFLYVIYVILTKFKRSKNLESLIKPSNPSMY